MVVDPDCGFADDSGFDRELLDLSLSASGAAGWTFDATTGDITWLGDAAALLGMPEAAAEDVRSRLLELIEPRTTGTALRPELHLERPVTTTGGSTRTVRLQARPLRRGRVLVGLIRDVTRQRRDQAAFADLADRYRLLVELSPDAICVHQNEVIQYANRAMAAIVGADSPDELVGRQVTDFVDSASIPRMRERINALTTPGAATRPARAELRRVDGAAVPVELVSVRTTWEGRPAQQVIGRDITTQKAAEAALRYQAALIQHVNNAIIATDRSGKVTSWNRAAEAVYGHAPEEALGRHVAELVGAPLDPESLSVHGATEAVHRRRDGATLVVRVSAAQMDSGYVLVCADETARRRAEQDFATVVAALDEGVLVIGPDGVESANPAAQRILGVPAERIVGSSLQDWPLHDESGAPLPFDQHPITRAQWTGVPEDSRVIRFARPDGRAVWLAVTAHALNPEDRPPHLVVASFTDITESRAARERLEYEATHDPLTGLANRTLVLQHLGRPQRTRPMAVLFADLDHFKIINDSLGHSTGDDVLRVVGKRLARTAPHDAVVGRLGGDEFVIVVDGEDDHDRLGALSHRVLGLLTEPIHVQGRQLHVNGSIGILVSPPGDRRTGEELLRDADVAMYQAKVRGGGRHAFFDVELRERIQRHMVLEQDLRHAVRYDELWLAYQPIIELRTNHAVAVEGLLRWTHPVHGLLSPAEFIPLAEESDLINSVGAHMMRVATRQLAADRQLRNHALRLNVNLSPRQLEDPDLLPAVRDALATSGLPPRALCLEITENAIPQDPIAAAHVMQALRDLGVRLAIDDFGTGYSSLAQMRRLPMDVLKIDQSFISDLPDSAQLEVVISSIVTMAHAFGAEVVAEGVETERQLALVRRLGCDQAQGHHIGTPEPIDRLVIP
ncbi:sensor domain-containing protein [Saccharopolyspora rosea]|uniref:EAL domain-containing protein n=1 Tax=Saccharopolyspora rosea TaxID=524884 RepID=A0ABW3FN25_9PSEU|nr:EAL domain-containing protein [Saccharopolyspora rosea]